MLLWCFSLFLMCWFWTDRAAGYVDGDVRLVGGKRRYIGTVVIMHDGKWGTVCDSQWDLNDAVVVCRQLGYTTAVRAALKSEFGSGNQRMWLTDVQCSGNETRLDACQFVGYDKYTRQKKCQGSKRSAGVICSAAITLTPSDDSMIVSTPADSKIKKKRFRGKNKLKSNSIIPDNMFSILKTSIKPPRTKTTKLYDTTTSQPTKSINIQHQGIQQIRRIQHAKTESGRALTKDETKQAASVASKQLTSVKKSLKQQSAKDQDSTAEIKPQSTSATKQPTTQPTSATTQPTSPATQSTSATKQPTSPTTQPTQPPSATTVPTTQSTSHTTQPTAQSTSHTTPPTSATTQSTLATTQPTSATTKPTTESTSSTPQTTSATTQPTPATTQPTPATTQPTSATTQPTSATTQPTTQPTPATTQPTSPTTQPTSATTQPKSATTQPTPATTQPTSAIPQPTTQPTPATTQPTSAIPQPTTQPTPATTQPTSATTQPTTQPSSTTQPTSATTQPSSTTQPTPSTTQPTTQPTSSTTQPTTQPTSSTTQPTTPPTSPTTQTPQETPSEDTMEDRYSLLMSLNQDQVEDTNDEDSVGRDDSPDSPTPSDVDLSTNTTGAGHVAQGLSDVKKQETEADNKSVLSDEPQVEVLEVRIKGGRYKWEGHLQVRANEGPWGAVCSDHWTLRETMVACNQLAEFGQAKMAVLASYYGGTELPKLYYRIKCVGREKNLSQCNLTRTDEKHTCSQRQRVAGVVCSNHLPDLVPNLNAIETSIRLQDQALYYLTCSMEENCLSSSAYLIQSTSTTWRNSVRRLMRFSTVVHNRGNEDFRPSLPRGQWQWHSCHRHYHSMEVFAHYDIMDSNGVRLAEGSKASFCLEDSACDRGVFPKFNCKGFADQGLSVNCSDNYMFDIDCQWIDITDIKPGYYTFLMEVNPDMLVAESNFDNNVVSCEMYYNGFLATLRNCRHQSLLDYRRPLKPSD
ncbi:mucin-2-like [Physella acuta]|uniref:mucin-2-like n=1 Tax=Physella acuta TaxID=109671 RepID=UPI0027DDBE9C|nr:mucin-2-like [Physella acuta]